MVPPTAIIPLASQGCVAHHAWSRPAPSLARPAMIMLLASGML